MKGNTTRLPIYGSWMKFTFDTEQQLLSAIEFLKTQYLGKDANKSKVRYKILEPAIPLTLLVSDISTLFNINIRTEFEKLGGSYVSRVQYSF